MPENRKWKSEFCFEISNERVAWKSNKNLKIEAIERMLD